MKRRYQTVAVTEVPGGFGIALDGKGMNTPGKAVLCLPGRALAEAIAAEWDAVPAGATLDPGRLPLTRLANTAIDLVPAKRDAVIAAVLAYGSTDLLCYRADKPPELVERQHRLWQPLLDWVAQRYDARMAVVVGLMPQAQPKQAVQSLTTAVAALDDWRLTALQSGVESAGSLVLGLALLDGRLDAATAFSLSELDDDYQIELWGEDPEATKRRRTLRADLDATERFARFLAQQGA